MHFFYNESVFGSTFILDGEEAKHANVLRLRLQEKIAIVNGKGLLYTGRVQNVEKKLVKGIIESKQQFDPPRKKLILATAITKNIDRFEWLLEKGTELGVWEFIPIICQNSERASLNKERLNKILLSALKQSGRTFLPKLRDIISLQNLVETELTAYKYISHISGLSYDQMIQSNVDGTILIVIGPEGDFSQDELTYLTHRNFKAISLGIYRLRTETAGLKLASLYGY